MARTACVCPNDHRESAENESEDAGGAAAAGSRSGGEGWPSFRATFGYAALSALQPSRNGEWSSSSNPLPATPLRLPEPRQPASAAPEGTDHGEVLGPEAPADEKVSEASEEDEDSDEGFAASPPPPPTWGGPAAADATGAKGESPEYRRRFGVPGSIGPVIRPAVADFVSASVTWNEGSSTTHIIQRHVCQDSCSSLRTRARAAESVGCVLCAQSAARLRGRSLRVLGEEERSDAGDMRRSHRRAARPGVARVAHGGAAVGAAAGAVDIGAGRENLHAGALRMKK